MSSLLKSLVRELGDYLKDEMPSLVSVVENFPNPNEELQYPALSIFSQQPSYRPELAPYVLSQGTVVNHQAPVAVVVGQYDFTLQLDLWCGNKEERFKLYDELFNAFHKDQPAGVRLSLTDYFDVRAQYDLSGHRFDDSEAGSQRAEWRVKVDVLANCKAVIERSQFIITQPVETQIETPNNIPEP